MTTPTQLPRSSAGDMAVAWFLRLQENPDSLPTHLEWQRWMNTHPAHRQAYEELEEAVLRLGRLPSVPPLPSAQEMANDTYDGSLPVSQWRASQASPTTDPARRRIAARLAIAASIVLTAIATGWLWTQQHGGTGELSYRTAAGERRQLELPDGSRVILDAGSALVVHLSPSRRSLSLERGEAFFQVAKDARRPFVVQAGAARVTAVGTAFNVRMSDDRTVVAVTDGRVELAAVPKMVAASPTSGTSPQLTAQVAAGETVAYVDNGNLQALPAPATPLAVAWLGGRRQYRNEPLRYVLADLTRHTGRRTALASQEAGDLRFTGSLNLKNSDAWLRGLSVALPVTITEQPDGTLLIAQR